MVGLGVVFLMVNLGRLNARSVLAAFAQYWPVFLILWGVVKLLEHAHARRIGAVAPGLGFGGVVLLLLFVLVGSAVTAAYHHALRVNWAGVREDLEVDDDMSFLLGQRFEYTEAATHELPAGGGLRVVASRASVIIVPAIDGQVRLTVHKSIRAFEKSEADAIDPRVKLQVSTEGKDLVIDATRRGDWAGARLALEIAVPPNAGLDLRTSRGPVDVRGRRAPVKAQVVNGDVTLEDITGDVTLDLRHGDLVARNVRGNVSVDGWIDDVVISHVEGAADLRGDLYGHLRVEAVSQGVRLNSERTHLEIPRLEGDVRLGDGALRVTTATGPLVLRTRSKNIDIEGVQGDIKVENRNGDVEVEPSAKAPLGNIEISGDSGTVRVKLPAAAGFNLDARTYRHGEITSDFEVDRRKDGDNMVATAVVNKGGAKVSIANEHGSIRLMRR
jgi:DUF4097 and DUF4098 domain-containing protein YvlB